MMRDGLMRLERIIRVAGLAVLLLGTVLRVTVADNCGVLRAVYYATPLPVLAAGWLGMAWLWGGWRRWIGIASLVLALGHGAWWIATSHLPERHPTYAAEAPRLKVLFWNMAHMELPSADLQRLLETFQPDVVGLVEVGATHLDPRKVVDVLPNGYNVLKLAHGMEIITRGSARFLHEDFLPSRSKYNVLEVTIGSDVWRVYIVDGTSAPTRSREDVLTRVLAEARGQPHTLVVGDFNTPIESPLFDPWRAELHHAFNGSGSGLRETWPRYVPVLTIDHVWSSKDAPPLRTEKRWLRSSDHAALLVELGQ
jgi:endonuclease/exonuclease/phosphatase family metal-dependent hydrolase